MQNDLPLYPYSAKEAGQRNELPAWRESFRENCACAGAIEISIREHFDGMHLKDGAVEWAVKQYGYKRVEHVLANTVQELSYDAAYVELRLIKEHQGEPTAASLFNYGEQFVFNYFELRGAAAKLTEGWTLDKIRDYTIENGCDPTEEEYRESAQALQAFRSQQAQTFSGEMCL